jgi:hypothetical protein
MTIDRVPAGYAASILSKRRMQFAAIRLSGLEAQPRGARATRFPRVSSLR